MSIQVTEIQKRFGNFTALDEVSLTFPDGELVALLGPSGCGKTTLLRIIAGLEHADRGQIVLAGQDAATLPVRERQVGFVFQHYALFKHMTVFDNIAFGMRMKPRRERLSNAAIQRKVEQLLGLIQLEWLGDRYPAQLSGGQRQRVALARALAVEPRVLLLDEPFGALDAKVRKELRRWLRQLHDELHITSIFVTHDQEEALEVADKIVVMNQGRVEQVGTPEAVYQAPATPFVYSFLGSVNLFHGRVEQGRVRVGSDFFSPPVPHVEHGTEVYAFARPHEVSLTPYQTDSAGIPAQINRILTLGQQAHIELSALHNEQVQTFEVTLDVAECQALQQGQQVRLTPTRFKLFPRETASQSTQGA